MRERIKEALLPVLGPVYEPLRDLFWKIFALDQKTSVAWLATFVVIALGYWIYRRRDAVGGLADGFWRYLFPKDLYLHASALADYRFFVVNKVMLLFAFGGLSLSATTVADACVPLLVEGFTRPELVANPWAVNAAFTLASMVAFDFAYFVAHWLMHKVPVLWEFHRLHHAAEVLTPVTNYREHPVDSLFQALLQGSSVGAVTALFLWAFPTTSLLMVAGVNLFYFPYYVFSNLRHSHVPITFGPLLDRIFCSPVQHQAHHGSKPEHIDVNFGIFLSVWDTLAGTLYLPKKDEHIVFGVIGVKEQEYTTLWKMYYLPFARAALRLRHWQWSMKAMAAAYGVDPVAAQPPASSSPPGSAG